MKSMLFGLFIILSPSVFCQVIKLDQKRSGSDIEVKNNDYTLYFKKQDILSAIKEINKVEMIDENLLGEIKADKFLSIDVKSKKESDKKIIEYFDSNLAVFLIIRKKVSIYKLDKPVKAVVADASPPLEGLDGKTKFKVFFSPENDEGQVFLGGIDKRLAKNFF
jgi:hypothetical protein